MPNPTEAVPRRHQLRRSRRYRIVAGVCGGLAEWLGWRPTIVRVLFVLVGALPMLSGVVVYLALWLLMPEASTPPGAGIQAIRALTRPCPPEPSRPSDR